MAKKITILLIIVVTLAIGYNLFSQIITATKSGERLSQAAEEVYKLDVKNKSLKEKLSQLQSPQFIEKEVRDKLGLARKGETVVVIPEEKLKMVLGASSAAQNVRLPNWQGWLKVFFR